MLVVRLARLLFLSCLCGSELRRKLLAGDVVFLSCLCGSERQAS